MQSISASKNTNHGRKLSLPPTLSTSSRQIQNPPTIPNWIGLRTMAQATFLCLNFNSVHKRTEISRKNIMTKHLWNHCRNTTLLQMARCDQDVRWSEPSTRLVMTRGRDAKLLTMTMKRTFVGVCAPSFSKNRRQWMKPFGSISDFPPKISSQKSTKKHIWRESEHPLGAESLDQAGSRTRRLNFSRGSTLSFLVVGLSHTCASQIGLVLFCFGVKEQKMLETWNHHLVSGSRNTTQTGSHTQVRDHKWVLDLSLDDDDGGCNRSTEHLAVGNFATDRAIGARRAWYSSPSNSSRVKPPTSQDRKKPTMRAKGQGNPHQDHLAKAIWLRSARQPWSHASATDTLANKDWQWRMILGFQCLILGIDWGFAVSRGVLLLRLLFLLVCNSLQLFSGRRLRKTKQKNRVRKYLGI